MALFTFSSTSILILYPFTRTEELTQFRRHCPTNAFTFYKLRYTFIRGLYHNEMTHMFEIRGAAPATRPSVPRAATQRRRLIKRAESTCLLPLPPTSARCCQTSALQIAYLPLPRPCDESEGPLIWSQDFWSRDLNFNSTLCSPIAILRPVVFRVMPIYLK